LGDGTYFHSGLLAIRQAVAAGATLTYKILFNDAVAMTGGQPVEGHLSVDGIAWQVSAEGAKAVVVVSDDPEKHRRHAALFPAGTMFHGRKELDAVQRRLRETKGVTVLIYDQTCAAELRRRRKRGETPDPDRRVFINSAVCEGCGDCGQASNCLSVLPVETDLGTKRRIDQSNCNKDASCLDGFCPSLVTVTGGRPRKRSSDPAALATLRDRIDRLPMPRFAPLTGPYDLLITGIGGTGVITLGAMVAVAAHLEGKSASVLDFMGFSQKSGPVLAFLRFADRAELLNQTRIDTQQADAMLVCDLVVGASAEALQSVAKGRTQVVANLHATPTQASVLDPDAQLPVEALRAKLRFAAGAKTIEGCDAPAIARRYLGDTIGANVLMLGFAWQRGLVPISLAALERAIALNGVAIEANVLAFHLGRLAAAEPEALTASPPAWLQRNAEAEIIDLADHLRAYQDDALAQRFLALVKDARMAIAGIEGAGDGFPLAVARSYAHLLAYKDEYEVARLFDAPGFHQALADEFEGDIRVGFHLAPPMLERLIGPRGKIAVGGWAMGLFRVLAKLKGLRGTVFDPFGHTEERRAERRRAADFAEAITRMFPKLNQETLPIAVEFAESALGIRGFGHVKAAAAKRIEARQAALLARLG
ncbi:MAG: indolepyruvate ferredoxin oxidoreductase family protein, partial [Alphaproteobacteria bacterium]|nr:indolepyruvate ferredoxin oxidoreductase family protein [Alphaproteobacteria bacterium]